MTTSHRSIPRFIRFGLFLVLLGAPLGAIIGGLYSRVSAFAGMPKAYCEASGVLLFLALALWIARTGTRETDADRSQEGLVVADRVIPMTPKRFALYLLIAAVVLVPLLGYAPTAPLGFVLASVAIGAPLVGLLLLMGRQHLRSVRRMDGRCQSCGYNLSNSPFLCPECRDPNNWRVAPRPSNDAPPPPAAELPPLESRKEAWEQTIRPEPRKRRIEAGGFDVRRQRRIHMWLILGSIPFAIGATVVYSRLPNFGSRGRFPLQPIFLPIGAWGAVLALVLRLIDLHRSRSIEPEAPRSMWPWSLPALLFLDSSDRLWRAYPWCAGVIGGLGLVALTAVAPIGWLGVVAGAAAVAAAAVVPPIERRGTRLRRRLFHRCERCTFQLSGDSNVCQLCGRLNDWRRGGSNPS
ncbi:MAG: hypothetical protein IBJ10_02015 [Phycisphaerales bacterium]|nr:hypothetical protein [Phycisphaerales bacterium]